MCTSLSFGSRKCYEIAMPAVSVICGRFVSIAQNEGNYSCRPTVPVSLSMYLGTSLNSGLCFTFYFVRKCACGSGDRGSESRV